MKRDERPGEREVNNLTSLAYGYTSLLCCHLQSWASSRF
jgi:hypothetical protein